MTFNEYASSPYNPSGVQSVLAPASTTTTRGMDLPVVFFDDFISGGYEAASGHITNAGDTGVWFNTNVEAGTGATAMVYSASVGGVLGITTAAGNNDGVNMQVNGESFALAADKPLVFEARIAASTIIDDWFVGLCVTDTSLKTAPAHYIGFAPTMASDGDSAADAKILCVNGKTASGGYIGTAQTNATVTDSGVTRTANVMNKLRFECDGVDTIRFYVDDVLKAKHTTNIPTRTLTPSITFLNSGTAVQVGYLDYVYCAQTR